MSFCQDGSAPRPANLPRTLLIFSACGDELMYVLFLPFWNAVSRCVCTHVCMHLLLDTGAQTQAKEISTLPSVCQAPTISLQMAA